jgi:hypothetical protein
LAEQSRLDAVAVESFGEIQAAPTFAET